MYLKGFRTKEEREGKNLEILHGHYSSFEEALEATNGEGFKIITHYPEEDVHTTSIAFTLEELEDIVTKDKAKKENLLDKALAHLALAHADHLRASAFEAVLSDPVKENDPQCLKDLAKELDTQDLVAWEDQEAIDPEEIEDKRDFSEAYPEAAAFLKEAMQDEDWTAPEKIQDLLAKVYSTGWHDGIDEQLKNESIARQKKKPDMTTLHFRLGLDEQPYMKVEVAKKYPFEKAIADMMYSGIYGEYETPDCSDALAYLHKVGESFMPQIENDMIIRECAD